MTHILVQSVYTKFSTLTAIDDWQGQMEWINQVPINKTQLMAMLRTNMNDSYFGNLAVFAPYQLLPCPKEAIADPL